MKKKSVRKKASKKTNSYSRYLILGFVIAAILIIAAASYQSLKNANVLGTSSFLAKDGIESSLNEDANKTPEPKDGNTNTASDSKIEDTHTPEPKEIETPEPKFIKPQITSTANIPPRRVEVQTEGNKVEINAAETGSQVELKTEDNGSLKLKVKKADGTEIQLETHALDDINEALKENDIEIGTTSAKGFSITNKETKAETEFPVSVNLASRTLSVDTPLGQKDLTVLPNQAVQNVLGQKIIDRVTENSLSGTSGAQLQLVQLKLFANRPVFQVQGVDDKKFLGIVPVGIQKTALISAETGQIVKTNEDLINRILDIFSFQ